MTNKCGFDNIGVMPAPLYKAALRLALGYSLKRKITKMRSDCRKGLRIRGDRGHAVVRRSLIRFARWLRMQYDFPIRVPVYLFPYDHVITMDGKKVSASFFAPFRRNVEPFIRIATGDYGTLVRKVGRDNALAAFICSLAHEVVHYQQWVATSETWERGVSVAARGILRRYAGLSITPEALWGMSLNAIG